jgi:hypothetical protein
MAIPLSIIVSKDRAAAFRSAVSLYLERYGTHVDDASWGDFREILQAYAGEHPAESDVPITVEKALVWAATEDHGIGELKEVRRHLDDALSDYGWAWHSLNKAMQSNPHFSGPRHGWMELPALALLRHRQASRALAEGWPTSSETEEAAALADMASGNFVDLDDAFARLAGTTTDQWRLRAGKHSALQGVE